MCPYLDNDKIYCHDCKNILFFLNLKESLNPICLATSNESSIIELTSAFSDEFNLLFDTNKTFLFTNTRQDVNIPSWSIGKQMCDNYHSIKSSESNFSSTYIIKDLLFLFLLLILFVICMKTRSSLSKSIYIKLTRF